MGNNINKDSELFKQSIIQKINEAKLPPSLIYYILKDVIHQIEEQYYKMVNSIQKDEGQEQKTQQN